MRDAVPSEGGGFALQPLEERYSAAGARTEKPRLEGEEFAPTAKGSLVGEPFGDWR